MLVRKRYQVYYWNEKAPTVNDGTAWVIVATSFAYASNPGRDVAGKGVMDWDMIFFPKTITALTDSYK